MSTTATTAIPAASAAQAPEKQGRRPISERTRSERRLGWILAGPAFIIMVAVTIYPILQAFYDSLFSFRLTAPGERRFIGLQNYGVVFSDSVFWRDLGVTVLITVITVAVELVLGFALALVMNHALKRMRGLLRTAILIPYGTITVVSAFAWFYMFDINSGYVNTWFSWLPGIGPDFDWFGSAAPR